MTIARLLFSSTTEEGQRTRSARSPGGAPFLEMRQSHMCIIAPVLVPNPLGDCRDDNPCRDNFPLYPTLSHPLVPHRLLCDAGD